MKIQERKYRFFLILAFLSISSYSLSQELEKKITLVAKDKSLDEIIREIGKLGNIYFSYNPQEIPVDRKITIRARNKTVREILDEVLTPNGIDYRIVEQQIILKARPSGPPYRTGEIQAEARKFTISGYLKDKTSGEVLIGANVYVPGSLFGTTSNAYGYYSLTIPGGPQTIVFSFIGYKSAVRHTDLKENQKLTVELEGEKVNIREIEILSGAKETEIISDQLSEIKFTSRTISQMPGFVGDFDIIKALQTIPGIRSFGDGSALFYVRGGNSDQNLILIDEAPIYNPAHLFGFISVLSPDAINDIQTYKGDFPASYGGRLSSVVDIRAKNGNLKQFGFSGNIGPYTSNLSLEGPILKNRSSFFVSGRVSTLNWLYWVDPAFKDIDLMFYDINAKLNFKLNENNRFFVTFYTGNDNFSRTTINSVNTYGIRWNNMAGTIRWNHIFNSKFFLNTTFNLSRYNYYLYLSEEQNDFWQSSISNLSLKTDLTWYLNSKNTIKAGIEVTSHSSNPGNVTISDDQDSLQSPEIGRYHSMEYVFYASNEQKIGKKILIRYGLRLPVWQDIGPTTVYYFNVNYQVSDTMKVAKNATYAAFISPEPRISVQFSVNDKSALKASYCRTTQFLQVLTNSTSPFTSLEVWAPSGPNINPQKADQFALGYFLRFFRSSLQFSAEAFYKQFYDHLDYKDHANLLYNPLIEGELRFGKAWSYGLEIMLKKPSGKLTGWIGYTYSRAFIQTDGVNDDKTYPAFYDRPHNVSINLSYDTYKHWSFAANWLLLSGGAITTPVGFYYNNGYSVPIYGDKNNDRLPAYHRLDLSVTYRLHKPESRFQHSLVLTLYNAYGRLNPFSVSFNRFMNDNGNLVIPSDLYGKYELVPTSISVAGIIPSINYQFKF